MSEGFLSAVSFLANALLGLISWAGRRISSSRTRSLPAIEDLRRTLMRSLFASLSRTALRSIVVTSSLEDILASKRYVPFRHQLFQPVKEGTLEGFWVCRGSIDVPDDPASSDIVILFCHGGGYVFGQVSMFSCFLLQVAEVIKAAGKSVSIFAVEYPLAPESPFPGALCSGLAAYTYLRTGVGVSPSRIVLMGDSAGGNLCLSIVRYLGNPDEQVLLGSPDLLTKFRQIDSSIPIRALILISPWISLNNAHSSFSQNAHTDIFHKKTLDQWAAWYRACKTEAEQKLASVYTEFAVASHDDYSWLTKLCTTIHLTAGADELFSGDAVDLTRVLRKASTVSVSLQLEAGREHDWQLAVIQSHQKEFLALRMDQQQADDMLKITEDIMKPILNTKTR